MKVTLFRRPLLVGNLSETQTDNGWVYSIGKSIIAKSEDQLEVSNLKKQYIDLYMDSLSHPLNISEIITYGIALGYFNLSEYGISYESSDGRLCELCSDSYVDDGEIELICQTRHVADLNVIEVPLIDFKEYKDAQFGNDKYLGELIKLSENILLDATRSKSIVNVLNFLNGMDWTIQS